jgi:hypothetical protein
MTALGRVKFRIYTCMENARFEFASTRVMTALGRVEILDLIRVWRMRERYPVCFLDVKNSREHKIENLTFGSFRL